MNGKSPLVRTILAFILFCVLLLTNLRAEAQAPALTPHFSPAIDNNINGFWEYLPRNYATDVTQTYPLLIFIHGNGGRGSSPTLDTLNKVLNAGTPRLLRNNNFPDSFFTAGKWYKFIVLAPQIKEGFVDSSSTVSPATIDAVINYAKSAYRVDSSRIYMGGLSMGGGTIWDYAGSSPATAGKLAAISVAAGAGDLPLSGAINIAGAGLPVIATHNIVDDLINVQRTIANIQLLKSVNPAVAPIAIYWTTPGEDNDKHNVWSRTYEDLAAGTTAGGNLRDTLGTTVYEWMLQYARPQNALPVTWKSFQAAIKNGIVSLKWETAQEQNIRIYEAERSRDGQTWETFATVLPKPGTEATKQYLLTDHLSYTGITYYRIRQIDLDGKYTYSAIEKTMYTASLANSLRVFPSPFKAQITVQLFSEEKQQVNIRLNNAAGMLVKQQRFSLSGGSEETLVLTGLQNLKQGVYVLELRGVNGTLLAQKKIFK
ncbi:MAG: T9SS type A sorting domain-containing protein [Williamsia sp.]|nr:T9SS type A sorting domain-containing protein [Williamsia sp.]